MYPKTEKNNAHHKLTRYIAAPFLCLTFSAPLLAASSEVAAPNVSEQFMVSTIRVKAAIPTAAHPISLLHLQALANEQLYLMTNGALRAPMTLNQLKQIADGLTQHYRDAGYLVARAYLPQQTLGRDGVVEIDVLEGQLGQVQLKGNSRIDDKVLTAPFTGLKGKPIRGDSLQDALLYAHDITGVNLNSTLTPGVNTGDTDMLLTATEADPLNFTLGGNNHGSDSTGKYRATAGLAWNNPLGLGDQFNLNYAKAFDPADSWQGGLSYNLPILAVEGLQATVGFSHSEIELSSGIYGALGLHGPSEQVFTGLNWKFVNTPTLKLQTSVQLVNESMRMEALGVDLTSQRFNVLDMGFSLRLDSPQRQAIDAIQLNLRTALNDNSQADDYLYPDHDAHFLLARLNAIHLQGMTTHQRLQVRVDGQYSEDSLTPIEQFSVGGPDSVRAYASSEALGDSGVTVSAEYQVDAPGFADSNTPFGNVWGDVITTKLFYDYGRIWSNGANQQIYRSGITLEGVGVGVDVHLPQWQGINLAFTAAHPTGSAPNDDKNVRYWVRFDLKF